MRLLAHKSLRTALTVLAALLLAVSAGSAQTVTSDKDTILLTVFLRHDQSKTLDEINDGLKKNGYYKKFPPQGVQVVSWYVAMGVGQIVTLRLPPDRVREVNRILEETAWGGYRTDFYLTYDYKAIAEQQIKNNQ